MTWVGVEPSSLFIAPGPPFLNTKQWQRPYLKQDVVAETVQYKTLAQKLGNASCWQHILFTHYFPFLYSFQLLFGEV